MKFGRLTAMMLMVAVLWACATGDGEYSPSPLQDSNLSDLMDGKKAQGLGVPFVRVGLEALESGDYVAAQAGFNRALKFDPTNSQLHFLNGLTYHLRSAAGDASQTHFAAIGYRLALQYDAANYWAAYHLGHINFNDQRFREAQDAFSYALLFAADEPTLLKALAVASYYAQDLETAAGAVEKLQNIAPKDAEVQRMSALVNAAGGRFNEADLNLVSYKDAVNDTNGERTKRVARRVNDWRQFHTRNAGFQLAQSTSDILGDKEASSGLKPDSSSNSSSSSSDKKKKQATRMAMVDVVIIRTEERRVTDKGLNLLSGLTATLGGTSFTYSDTRTVNAAAANSQATVFTYTPTLSIAATYSLNIFNDNNDHNEVLARPSLVALDGKKSEFFTGAVLHVELTGSAGSEGAVQEIPVGIKLHVTPKFLSDDVVQLEVEAARAFIEGRTTQTTLSAFAQVTKTLLTANVAMKFGDTLVISGLSEKETEKLNDGVPLLQDVPVLQYLFSHQDTLDFTKSVLILLTPRKPRYVHADGSPKMDRANPADAKVKQPNLAELKGRSDWFKPASNLDAVFQHLKDRRLFKEFRNGDVRLEKWEDEIGLGLRIKRAVEFLYF